jgi:hypothetical protein
MQILVKARKLTKYAKTCESSDGMPKPEKVYKGMLHKVEKVC